MADGCRRCGGSGNSGRVLYRQIVVRTHALPGGAATSWGASAGLSNSVFFQQTAAGKPVGLWVGAEESRRPYRAIQNAARLSRIRRRVYL